LIWLRLSLGRRPGRGNAGMWFASAQKAPLAPKNCVADPRPVDIDRNGLMRSSTAGDVRVGYPQGERSVFAGGWRGRTAFAVVAR